jgi:hypothetical protein
VGVRGVVQTALAEGYSHKVPKVVVGSLDATLQLVRWVQR